jgi:putative ABC transport system ATP-binding protein
METTHIKRLDQLELFADCRRAELRRITPLTTLLDVAKDQVLMREGEIAQQFIILGDGTARITRETEGGVATVADVGSGAFIGETALLAGTRLTSTATATTDLTVFVSSASEFRSMLRIAPSVEHKVRRSSLIRPEGTDAAA